MKNIVVYNTGELEVNVSIEEETLWLNQKQLGELFNVEIHTINYHIKNIFKQKELEKIQTHVKSRKEQKKYPEVTGNNGRNKSLTHSGRTSPKGQRFRRRVQPPAHRRRKSLHRGRKEDEESGREGGEKGEEASKRNTLIHTLIF